jgi:[CysO sulfur-carrier protein]-S-L-cysteine hydrolase
LLRISSQLLEEIYEHAREESPRECCGLIGCDAEGRAASVHRVRNVAVNRKTAYFMDGQEQYRAFQAIEDAGQEVGAIYHSHPRSEPVPSPTDVNLAKHWPGMQWMIVGLAGPGPEARTWQIVDTSFHEDPHEVQDGTPVDA